VYLENLNRILPKGEFLPVPLISVLTVWGRDARGRERSKEAFLEGRARRFWGLRRGENAQVSDPLESTETHSST